MLKEKSLKEALQSRLLYYQNYANGENDKMCQGYVRGLKEMLENTDLSSEKFFEKFDGISKALKDKFETAFDNNIQIEDAEELSGYNNAIVEVLCLFDKEYDKG